MHPNLSCSVSMVNRYMSNPWKVYWQVVKKILRYLRGTSILGLLYGDGSIEHGVVESFVDSDFGGDVDKRRSLTGYVFTPWESAISWKANLQSIVAFSSTKEKYIVATKVVKEDLWLKGMINDLGINQKSMTIHYDSQSAIHLMKNHVYHESTKHIDVRMHFVWDMLAQGFVLMKKICTKSNIADMLTKVLPSNKFRLFLSLIGAVQE